jgi:hypothetical protein
MHYFSKATRILHRFPPDSRDLLDSVCRQIQDAEKSLNTAAAIRMQGCLKQCQGMCCRNLNLEAIFGVADFAYILAAQPGFDSAIRTCLQHERPIFTSDCPFLENGTGPCIFPSDVRPEVCITSFCRGEDALRAEIRRVKKGFWRLGVVLTLRKVPFIHRMLCKLG